MPLVKINPISLGQINFPLGTLNLVEQGQDYLLRCNLSSSVGYTIIKCNYSRIIIMELDDIDWIDTNE